MPTLELSDKDKIEFDNIDTAIINYIVKHSGCSRNTVRTELNRKEKDIKEYLPPKPVTLESIN